MDEMTTVAIPDCTGIEIEFAPSRESETDLLNHALYQARMQAIDLQAELAASVRLLRQVRVLLERSHTLLALRRGSAITEAEKLIDAFLLRQDGSDV